MKIFSRKKINISNKKMKKAISSIKKFSFENKYNFTKITNKKSFKEINKLLTIVKKSTKGLIKNYELFSNKNKTKKKQSERAKGKLDIIKKRYCNIFFILKDNGK